MTGKENQTTTLSFHTGGGHHTDTSDLPPWLRQRGGVGGGGGGGEGTVVLSLMDQSDGRVGLNSVR